MNNSIFDYYKRSEVSNSDLSQLKNDLNPKSVVNDPYLSYRFGNLLDVIITEPNRADFFKRKIEDEQFSLKEFKKAERMKNAFLKDDFCRDLIKEATFQDVSIKNREFSFRGITFNLPCRCKWDVLLRQYKLGADIKTTTAKTQREFEAAITYFEYDRQSAWYMDLEDTEEHIIIGISKENNKVFKYFINRKSNMYINGKDKYEYLAFKWWLLYGNLK